MEFRSHKMKADAFDAIQMNGSAYFDLDKREWDFRWSTSSPLLEPSFYHPHSPAHILPSSSHSLLHQHIPHYTRYPILTLEASMCSWATGTTLLFDGLHAR
ncbi:hypothetical protein EVAR_6638_1 [Eumeta japonica]|uniref:Uncharacterized protein n=1 Tax=Eumeta variegata TaxID=151549 RepID=A0A4C1TNB2_EUMVA|nr:hypothetical protein EVAR_6638_1 [Eumeta japonica]